MQKEKSWKGVQMGTHDDRENRLSWSEIDKLKDRSKHAGREKTEFTRKSSAQEEWAKKQYMKELDKLFSGKKEESEEQKKARLTIGQHYGSSKFNSVVSRYVKKYGIPADWSTLILLLDHRDVNIVMESLQKLRNLVHEGSTAERDGFKSKVKILAMTTDSEELQELTEEILEEL